ncbi:MAG: flagellar FlbD family protein [candidate division Zixibacteria bacterium]
MINVTRLDNSELVINSDLIEIVEAIPETIIHLTTGKKIMVCEKVDEIIERVSAFKRDIAAGLYIRRDDEGQ